MSTSTPNTLTGVPEFIKKSIDKELTRIIDEEIEEAKKRVDRRKSDIIAGILLHVQKQMDMQTMGEKLIFSINLKP